MDNAGRLREIRESKGLSGTKVAELLGISPQYYYELEKGKKRLNDELLMKLAELYNVSTDYLLGRTDDPRPVDQITLEAQKRIEEALHGDEELLAFWQELKEREELQLLFKQTRPLSPLSIKKIIKIIKAIEDAEAMED
ncbi:helix-turn-helix domain-containing protein [Thermanaeromonas sp. C210]|uniref:helix-turn-helix domain-containing protein n=1 Tax=Thermanaeromonas sp. C210 TaxID=2731925 RepID=UPI00155BA531|nr:helix-turn-helix transcriptional regulator [Thermanaeromonas sp. C210]GFN21930.1 hypothetical protein TAMC210_02460 [Thermanaeromonas sp. C210]